MRLWTRERRARVAMVVGLGASAALPGARAGAQTDGDARLYPLLAIGAARALPATLAERGATTDAYSETMRVRLDGQWGIIAEGRLPLGARKVWGIEAYGARFRGGARASAGRTAAQATAPRDSIDYRLRGVTSWRATLGVLRAVPLPGRLTAALLVGGTVGRVTSPDAACTPVAPSAGGFAETCPPKLDVATPGGTVGADVFTPPFKRFRLRFSVKDDVLRVDEAAVRRSLRWAGFASAPAGEGEQRWHMFPTGTVGVEYEFRF